MYVLTYLPASFFLYTFVIHGCSSRCIFGIAHVFFTLEAHYIVLIKSGQNTKKDYFFLLSYNCKTCKSCIVSCIFGAEVHFQSEGKRVKRIKRRQRETWCSPLSVIWLCLFLLRGEAKRSHQIKNTQDMADRSARSLPPPFQTAEEICASSNSLWEERTLN